MMTATRQTAIEDLDYVRQLSESGARAPLLGGRFMAWWGLLLTAAYAAHHFALKGLIGDGDTVFAIIWMTFVAAGVAGQLALARSMPAKPGTGLAGNRAARSVWAAGAFAIGAMILGTSFAAATVGAAAYDWIVPVAFAVYACALIVTGSLAGNRLTIVAGAGAIAMVALFTAFIFHPDRYLLAAAGVAGCVLLPGLLLVGREPRTQG